MKTIEEIQAEEQQLAMDIADYAAHQPSSTAGGPVATDTTASAEPAPPVASTGGVTDLTPEQQTGAAPLTEDPAQAPVSAAPSTANEAIPATSEPAAEPAPATSEPAAEPASATEVGGEPGAGATTETPAPEAAATAGTNPAQDPVAANSPPATVATPDPATTGASQDTVAVSKSGFIAQVEGFAKKVWGEAAKAEETAAGFFVKVGEEVKHIFSWF